MLFQNSRSCPRTLIFWDLILPNPHGDASFQRPRWLGYWPIRRSSLPGRLREILPYHRPPPPPYWAWRYTNYQGDNPPSLDGPPGYPRHNPGDPNRSPTGQRSRRPKPVGPASPSPPNRCTVTGNPNHPPHVVRLAATQMGHPTATWHCKVNKYNLPMHVQPSLWYHHQGSIFWPVQPAKQQVSPHWLLGLGRSTRQHCSPPRS